MTSANGAYDPANRPIRSLAGLDHAYAYLNQTLFEGALPTCLITVQRTKRTYGYFSAERFVNIDNPSEIVDEIALNPIHFAAQSAVRTLATMAHEMTHLWQHRFGKPSRGGYHNSQWASKMQSIGLVPSSTGAAGGKPTGDTVSHFIQPGGRFQQACAAYLESNATVLFQDRAYRELQTDIGSDTDRDFNDPRVLRLQRAERERERKAASKTRFSCSRCSQHAWGSQRAKLLCGGDECDGERMAP